MTVERPGNNSASPIVARNRQYKDLNLGFTIHPVSGDVRPVKDVNAIKNSIKNLLLTRKGERPHRPDIGSDIDSFLFDLADPITERLFKENVVLTINRFEPRVRIDLIETDLAPERNSWRVDITFTIIGTNEQTDVVLYLERLR